jgi:hypothetical protein
MKSRTLVYIVCSPRPRVGKTLLARLLAEFFDGDGRRAATFDVNPDDFALTEFIGGAVKTDLTDTRGQMALFDRLIRSDEVPKVVDLGYAAFDPFFNLMQQIDFLHEARRRSVQPVLLYLANPDRGSKKAYDTLRERFRLLPLVPVYNDANAQEHLLLDGFPVDHGSPLRIGAIPQMVKGVVDRPGFSFAEFLQKAGDKETLLHPWLRRAFIEIRELELRLLLDQLRLSLPLPT